MKKYILFFVVIISFGLLQTCELMDTAATDKITAQSIEGSWKCNESSSLFKAAKDYYNVYIEPHATDSFKVYISNFYQLGNDVEALATVNDYSLSIATQTLKGGYSINGSGTIAKNLKTITLKYNVNDGSGKIDEVDATYEFLY